MLPYALVALLSVAGPGQASEGVHVLRDALTFHASFDGSADADFARGDPKIYTSAPKRQDAKAGLHRPDVSIVEDGGRFGDALHCGMKSPKVLFYQAADNVAYASKNFAGTVSLWMRLDPEADLPPGYSDPLIITQKGWDDGSIFVDFTKDERPRHFRMGIFADKSVWNPKMLKWDDVPEKMRPFVTVTRPPFGAEKWTHVVLTFEKFNTGRPDGAARFYLDGRFIGALTERQQTYTWQVKETAIVLGINYVGLYDDLAVFSRALTDDEVRILYRLPNGVRALRPR